MARDFFYETVKTALQVEGWHISHDPLTIKLSKRKIFIDLGAEKILIAEKNERKIAVEIKSFLNISALTDFYHAIGQYQLYALALKDQYPDRLLYLAIPNESFKVLKSDDLLAMLINQLNLRYLIYDPLEQTPLQWIN